MQGEHSVVNQLKVATSVEVAIFVVLCLFAFALSVAWVCGVYYLFA